MKYLNLLVAAAAVSGIAACGGNGGSETRTCDEVRAYQLAAEGKRVEAPEGLDALDPLKEMPLPEANPRPPRPAGSPCIDLPPSVLSGG